MTQTRAPTNDRAAVVEPAQQVDRPQARSPEAGRKRHLSSFCASRLNSVVFQQA